MRHLTYSRPEYETVGPSGEALAAALDQLIDDMTEEATLQSTQGLRSSVEECDDTAFSRQPEEALRAAFLQTT